MEPLLRARDAWMSMEERWERVRVLRSKAEGGVAMYGPREAQQSKVNNRERAMVAYMTAWESFLDGVAEVLESWRDAEEYLSARESRDGAGLDMVIVRRRYICCQDWQAIAEAVGVTARHARRLHNQWVSLQG